MNPQQLETITKAKQAANLLNADLREAHKQACQNSPLLAMFLREVMEDSQKVEDRLTELEDLQTKNKPK
jgi:hypothetical protein